ncbi:MAG: hypothetical protein HY774_13230 [Acidobacteria bacterium]|nr:hypothetical protein [Acidobacteriota bacterium]
MWFPPEGRWRVAGGKLALQRTHRNPGRKLIRARMGAGFSQRERMMNRADDRFQRPSGRKAGWVELRWYAQSGKPPATFRRPAGENRVDSIKEPNSIPNLWGLVLRDYLKTPK